MQESYNADDLAAANARLATIPFYPSLPAAQAEVMVELARMCPHREALRWLVDTAARKCLAWPGLGELRGLLCWRYKPADGIESTCSVGGFTAADGEERSYQAHQQIKAGGVSEEFGWLMEEVKQRRLLRGANGG